MFRTELLASLMRREILRLSEAENVPLTTATSIIATEFSGRRRAAGLSPADCNSVGLLAFTIGAELREELAVA